MMNIFADIPDQLPEEQFTNLCRGQNMRIERIVSHGHTSPTQGWYDQDADEWVIVLSGHARLEFENGGMQELSAGDYINIPAHVRHRVAYTDPDEITVWLAVFYLAVES
ncbi:MULTISPECIES: cupin domain-containing protein [unclassified Vibrio]|uniref:cupin domain-containing protein n=1 Tax=unclassified Vibrio TaxID=2614977 RepID=UPI00197E4F65|nr:MULTISPECIES: cupin domain-containing protein [unclassified Vibrio]WGY45083.1 cupin domain-containing protein [Vibrio sp. ABG19]